MKYNYIYIILYYIIKTIYIYIIPFWGCESHLENLETYISSKLVLIVVINAVQFNKHGYTRKVISISIETQS